MSINKLNAQGVYPNVAEVGTVTFATPAGTGESAYQQIIASSTRAAIGMIVTVSVPAITGTQTSYLVDIATGAGGSEVVKIPDLLFATIGVDVGIRSVYFPFDIPAGTRIACRASDDNGGGGGTITVSVHLLGRN